MSPRVLGSARAAQIGWRELQTVPRTLEPQNAQKAQNAEAARHSVRSVHSVVQSEVAAIVPIATPRVGTRVPTRPGFGARCASAWRGGRDRVYFNVTLTGEFRRAAQAAT